MTVTFFGHRDAPCSIKKQLTKTLEALIVLGADTFYVGNNGNFDSLVKEVLEKLKRKHPHIAYGVVVAYFPAKFSEKYSTALYPEILETVSGKAAIPTRNEWLVNNSDVVVAYVKRGQGGAYKFCSLAKKRGKWVINLAKKEVIRLS